MKIIALLLFGFFSFSAYAQIEDSACDVMKNATKLKEKNDNDPSAYYVIDGQWFYDYSNKGKEYIKSKIEWQDDCTYMLTLVETNIPNFDLKYGTQLRVQVTAVNDNEITYEYLPKGVLEGGVLEVIE